jgi:hypothetical protein
VVIRTDEITVSVPHREFLVAAGVDDPDSWLCTDTFRREPYAQDGSQRVEFTFRREVR